MKKKEGEGEDAVRVKKKAVTGMGERGGERA